MVSDCFGVMNADHTDNLDIVIRCQLTLLGSFAVPSRLGCQVNNDTTGLHDIEHVLRNELWRGLARNQSSRYNDVDILGLFFEQVHLGIDEFLAHFLCIATSTRSVFLELDFDELGSKGLNLLSRGGSCIESSHNSTHSTCRSNGTQAGDTSTNDQYFTRRDLPSSCYLASQKSAKHIGGFKNGFVASNVGHAAQYVKYLGSGNAWNHIHRKASGFSSSNLVHKLLVLGRLKKRDYSLAFFDVIHLTHTRTSNLENDVGLGPDVTSAVDKSCASLLIGGVQEISGCAGTSLDEYLAEAFLLEKRNIGRSQSHATFSRKYLTRNTNGKAIIRCCLGENGGV